MRSDRPPQSTIGPARKSLIAIRKSVTRYVATHDQLLSRIPNFDYGVAMEGELLRAKRSTKINTLRLIVFAIERNIWHVTSQFLLQPSVVGVTELQTQLRFKHVSLAWPGLIKAVLF
jgi:hypothetical protein